MSATGVPGGAPLGRDSLHADPKTHFLELEQRWLRAAESVTPKIVREAKARIAEPTVAGVTRPQVARQVRATVAISA
jgi:hypothetical protein